MFLSNIFKGSLALLLAGFLGFSSNLSAMQDPSEGACDAAPNREAKRICRKAYRTSIRVQKILLAIETGDQRRSLQKRLERQEARLSSLENAYLLVTGDAVPGFGPSCNLQQFKEWYSETQKAILPSVDEGIISSEPTIIVSDTSGIKRCNVRYELDENHPRTLCTTIPYFNIDGPGTFNSGFSVRASAAYNKGTDTDSCGYGVSFTLPIDIAPEDAIACAIELGCDNFAQD